MKRQCVVTILLCSLALQATAREPVEGVYWERDAARAAINAVQLQQAVAEIGDVSSLADAEATLGRLNELESRSDWPMPVREAVLYRFTRSLVDLPRDAVAPEIMQYLREYPTKTLVPHEERQNAFVPLFNIRGAAAGVENGWQRTEATTIAVQLLKKDPLALIGVYLQSSDDPQRFGYLDAVQLASFPVVTAVQEATLQQIADNPGLTPLLNVTSTITADRHAMQELLIHGRGAGLKTAFDHFEQQLDRHELAGLLSFAISAAPDINASLAMAAWWPRLKHDPATRELLFKLLPDAELGSSAVLALSQEPDIQTIKMLQDAAMSDSVTSLRAQQALDLSRDVLTRKGVR